jgi:hypothetical protein
MLRAQYSAMFPQFFVRKMALFAVCNYQDFEE